MTARELCFERGYAAGHGDSARGWPIHPMSSKMLTAWDAGFAAGMAAR